MQEQVTRRCSTKKFSSKLHKISVLESLFDTAKGLQAIRLVTLLKGNPIVLEPALPRCSLKKVFFNN